MRVEPTDGFFGEDMIVFEGFDPIEPAPHNRTTRVDAPVRR